MRESNSRQSRFERAKRHKPSRRHACRACGYPESDECREGGAPSGPGCQQAVAYNLAVLGEGARAISQGLRDRYPDVPWRDLIAQRNLVVHEYHRIDFENIWTTVTEDTPQLDQMLSVIQTTESARS